MTKRVLILNWRCPDNPKAGGAERVTLKHGSYWVKQGWQVVWLAGGFKGSQRQEMREGIEIIRYGNSYTIYLLAPLLYWLKWKSQFDIVVDEVHGIPFFTPLWAWKSKKIAYIHEVAGNIWDEMFKPPWNWLGKLGEKLYLRMYRKTRFWAVSESTKNNLLKLGIPPKKVKVITNGIEVKPQVQQKKEQELTLIVVGRVVAMKKIDEAIELMAEIKQQIKGVRLWVVGRGEKKYIDKLQKYAKEQKVAENIKWWGWVSEEKKKKLLAKAHFLVNMSVKEGFGLVVLEANEQGTPAVGKKVAGLQDVIKEGINGFLITDIQEGAKKIEQLFKNKKAYAQLSKQSREYVKKYDWQKILRSSFNLLSSL